MSLIRCPECDKEISSKASSCPNCGYPVSQNQATTANEFNGVYRYSFWGSKTQVHCPRCGSENCSHYQDQKIIPAKTKTKYSANLNPLRPFTLLNKKEKVVRKEQIITENKFLCNSCGKIFN